MRLDEAPQGYEIFKKKEPEWIKIVLKPWHSRATPPAIDWPGALAGCYILIL